MFSHSRGDRPDVRNVAILVTDGESNVNETHTLYEADLAKAMGINFFVVGFTNAIDILELMSISSEPVTGHFFATADAQSLIQLQEELVRFICSSGGSRAKRKCLCSTREGQDFNADFLTSENDFLISRINFWYQKMPRFSDIRNYILVSETPIFWYQKIISDIRKSNFWYQKIIFWYQKIGIKVLFGVPYFSDVSIKIMLQTFSPTKVY